MTVWTAGALRTLGSHLLCLLLSSRSSTGWVEFFPTMQSVFRKVTKRRRRHNGALAAPVWDFLYEYVVPSWGDKFTSAAYMDKKVAALKPAADGNVPGVGKELVNSWALSPFLSSFSVCPWDVRRCRGQCQPHPRVNTSGALEGLTFPLSFCTWHLSLSRALRHPQSCVHPPPQLLCSPPRPPPPQSRLALADVSRWRRKASFSRLDSFNWNVTEKSLLCKVGNLYIERCWVGEILFGPRLFYLSHVLLSCCWKSAFSCGHHAHENLCFLLKMWCLSFECEKVL